MKNLNVKSKIQLQMINKYLQLNLIICLVVDCWFITTHVDGTKIGIETENTFIFVTNIYKPPCCLFILLINKGTNSIFIVYDQSRSGEKGHLGVLAMLLKYLFDNEKVENIKLASIKASGTKAAKICFFDLVHELKLFQKDSGEMTDITRYNCLDIITQLQNVSYMAPTLKNYHSSRGHTIYFACVKMLELEAVYFTAVDLATRERPTAFGTEDEFVDGLKLVVSEGKLDLNAKQLLSFEGMYKIRSLEAGLLFSLQYIFSVLNAFLFALLMLTF